MHYVVLRIFFAYLDDAFILVRLNSCDLYRKVKVECTGFNPNS